MKHIRQILCGALAALALLSGCAAPASSAPPAATAAPTPSPTPAPTPEPTPRPAAQQVELTASGEGLNLANINDPDNFCKVRLSADTAITLQAETNIGELYLVFDRPVEWRLETADGTEQACGQNGFIHEYVELEQPASTVTLHLPADTVLCEVYAFTPGQVPDWVQQWQPPCEKADLLVLPTHADDEHLWFGGTLPYYAGEKGYAVQVAYMTNHWGEPYRPHELLNGLWTVGVRNYPVISDFPDLYASKESLESARQVYNEEEVTAWQVEQLRRFKPSVVLGHDIDGEYGHGAHMLNAVTLLSALEMSGDAARFPESAEEYGVWQVPKCYLHLWPENTIQMEWGEMPLASFDGRTALEMAAEGFACHVSQTQWFEVKAGGSNDCRKFGLAYTNVGPDEAKNDFFENIPSAFGGPA